MATFYSTGYGGNYPERMTLRTVATINSQSIVNNTSNVTISAYAYYNYTQTAPNPTDGGQSLRIDDVRVHSASKNLDYTGSNSGNQLFLFSWTGDIAHASDGTKTVNIKVWQDCPDVTTLEYLYGSHSWTLTTIPRVSTPTVSASTVALGSKVIINTNRADTSLLHALDYSIGSQSATIATNVGDSFEWTVPLGIADVLPSGTSGTVTITCYTWSGSTHIGTKTVTLTATVPNAAPFKPTVSIDTVAEAATEMIGAGFYLAGKSRVNVQASGFPKYSAAISSYSVTVDTATLSGSNVTSAVISKTGDIAISVTVTDSRGYTGTASTTVNFKTLAAPTVSAASINVGSALTITTNRHTTAISHTLKYTIGAQSLLTIASSVGASTDPAWTVPLNIADAIPSATSGIVTITQYSYNGSNLLGSTTVTFTAMVPNTATFKPTATISSITEGATGLTAFTVFVQNKSKLRVQSMATGKYSATISQYKVTIAGTATHYGADITSAIQGTSGAKSILLTVTDSRGYTNTHELSATVIAYSPPVITSFTASRSPTDQDSGLSAPINFTISPVSNQNTKRYLLRYKPTDGSYTNIIDSTAYYTRSFTHTAAAGTLDPNLGYEVELTVYDYFTSVSRTVNIATAFDLINYNASGKGLAFGKVSEVDGLEFALPVYNGIKGIVGTVYTYENWGSFYAGSSSNVGAIVINLGTTNFMFNAQITVRSYFNLVNLTVGGYTYTSTTAWHLPQATGTVFTSSINVRFSADGAARYMIIGDSGTDWGGYLHVTIDKISVGYSGGTLQPFVVSLAGTIPGTVNQTYTIGGSGVLAAYPVGSIYLSAASTSPATLFGGTWIAFGTGRTLVGIDPGQTEFNTIEKTGGHKNLQAHTHAGSSGSAGDHGHTASSGTAGAHTHTGTAASTGGHMHTGTAASAGSHTHTIDYQRFTGLSTSTSESAFDLNRRAGTSSYGSSAAAQSAGAHTHAVSTVSAGDHSHTVSTVSAGDHSHTVSVVAATAHTHTVTIGSTGAGTAENLQPYITVYMWKRTA
ncbi:hypothetical protein DSECCO2_309970 [anaerobic digester metagenome]